MHCNYLLKIFLAANLLFLARQSQMRDDFDHLKRLFEGDGDDGLPLKQITTTTELQEVEKEVTFSKENRTRYVRKLLYQTYFKILYDIQKPFLLFFLRYINFARLADTLFA